MLSAYRRGRGRRRRRWPVEMDCMTTSNLCHQPFPSPKIALIFFCEYHEGDALWVVRAGRTAVVDWHADGAADQITTAWHNICVWQTVAVEGCACPWGRWRWWRGFVSQERCVRYPANHGERPTPKVAVIFLFIHYESKAVPIVLARRAAVLNGQRLRPANQCATSNVGISASRSVYQATRRWHCWRRWWR